MKTNTLRSPGVAVAALVAAGWWYFSREEEPPAPGPLGKALAAAQRFPERLLPGKNPPPWPEFRTPEFHARIKNRARAYLESRERNADNLIAMWDLTRDAELLDEAARQFPGDPLVCMAMIEAASDDPQQALPWIERLIALDRFHSGGLLLKVWALHRTGDRAGALAALRAAVATDSPPHDHLRTRATALREAALACGLPVREAALLPLHLSRENPLARLSLASITNVVFRQLEALKGTGDDSQLFDVASLGHWVAFNLPEDSPRVLAVDHAAHKLEASLYLWLPDDRAVNESGLTAADWKAQTRGQLLRDLQALDHSLKSGDSLLRNASDEIVIEYANRFLEHGEQNAFTWIMEQSAAAP